MTYRRDQILYDTCQRDPAIKGSKRFQFHSSIFYETQNHEGVQSLSFFMLKRYVYVFTRVQGSRGGLIRRIPIPTLTSVSTHHR